MAHEARHVDFALVHHPPLRAPSHARPNLGEPRPGGVGIDERGHVRDPSPFVIHQQRLARVEQRQLPHVHPCFELSIHSTTLPSRASRSQSGSWPRRRRPMSHCCPRLLLRATVPRLQRTPAAAPTEAGLMASRIPRIAVERARAVCRSKDAVRRRHPTVHLKPRARGIDSRFPTSDEVGRPGRRRTRSCRPALTFRGSRHRLKRIKIRGNGSLELWLMVGWVVFLVLVVLPWMMRHSG